MKVFNYFILLIFFIAINCKAERLFVEIKNDTIRICDIEAYEHCAFSPEIIVTVKDSVITIVEKDTMTDMTTCMCNFDYFITLTGLQNQEYQVVLYRQYSAPFMNTDSLYFIATTRFNFDNDAGKSFSKSVASNNCYQLNDISNHNSVSDDEIELTSYPNPGNPEITFRFYVAYSGYISMVIYNLNGQLLQTIMNQRVSSGEHYLTYDPKSMATGMYICKLIFNSKIIKVHKFTVIR